MLDIQKKVISSNPLAKKFLKTFCIFDKSKKLTHFGEQSIVKILFISKDSYWKEVIINKAPRQIFEVYVRLLGKKKNIKGWVLVINEVTEERLAQERTNRQERLASIGQLAGGIAYDFNNMLTVISGYTDLLLGEISEDCPIHSDLMEIKNAAKKSATLTHQLLAFGRRQILQPSIENLNMIIVDMEKMLLRLLGENIDFVIILDPDVGNIKADPVQLEQVIMNLIVNAREAMPTGGALTIETKNVFLDEDCTKHHNSLEPGDYVMLAISDTGIGIPAEIMSHIFEPFCTTKSKEKGTGLGLATVYGIVKQSGGNIWVYSESKKGTSNYLFLSFNGKCLI